MKVFISKYVSINSQLNATKQERKPIDYFAQRLEDNALDVSDDSE
jgi:hypothetical protein